jgi:tRNA wybutosine-synthesizing protein 2
MPVQIWIQTQKENVQKVKLALEQAGQLSKAQKVKPGQQDGENVPERLALMYLLTNEKGYMIIPTKKCLDEEVNDEAGYFTILSDLYLCGASQYAAAEIIYLPSPSPNSQCIEPRSGPIQDAVLEWLNALPDQAMWNTGAVRTGLLESSPRRWSTYEPMLLLPSGSFQDATWKTLLESMDETHLCNLWKTILHTIWKKEGGKELTHLAINSGIPSKEDFPLISEQENHPATPSTQENVLRSPSGLILLHGDFGPHITNPDPTAADFRSAFWVTSKQNGIFQTWAPRYTMFSRGNIKEKARLLAFHDADAVPESRKRIRKEERKSCAVVDLYAGIGYFAFSYAAAGFGRVLCWEINPWSVEGLRRGCERNGWGCRVVRGGDLERPVEEVLSDGARVVVFEEGNENAAARIKTVREWEGRIGEKVLADVVHVNCGLLPSSEKSWRAAWRIVCKSRSAWLHLHENVGVHDVEKRRKEIELMIGQCATEDGGLQIVEVEHVELVKTFAPGVWHCVFDVQVKPALTESS